MDKLKRFPAALSSGCTAYAIVSRCCRFPPIRHPPTPPRIQLQGCPAVAAQRGCYCTVDDISGVFLCERRGFLALPVYGACSRLVGLRRTGRGVHRPMSTYSITSHVPLSSLHYCLFALPSSTPLLARQPIFRLYTNGRLTGFA